jgi:hypothetical protein
MLHTKVISREIESVGYDESKKLLEIWFRRSNIYHYFDITKSTYLELIKSQSPEEYFRQNILNKCEYKKMNSEIFELKVTETVNQNEEYGKEKIPGKQISARSLNENFEKLKNSREPKEEQSDKPSIFMIKCIKCKSEFDQGKSNHRKCPDCRVKKIVKSLEVLNNTVEKLTEPEKEFDENNMHYITGTKFDEKLFTKYGINRITSTKFDKHGYDKDGYNKNGYDKDGYGKDGYDKHGNKKYSAKKNFGDFYNQ